MQNEGGRPIAVTGNKICSVTLNEELIKRARNGTITPNLNQEMLLTITSRKAYVQEWAIFE